ncbi:MAG: 50S ribosomal protein L17 [Flavobacteriales bacterium]|nr:50S ribosomal protein L17 [Flavobacteriales bacterium]
MRHGKKINHLSRTAEHRKAMLVNMASSLIEHKRIYTTVAKAKALKKYIEPIITKSKTDTTHSRRVVFAQLKNKEAVTELFRDVAVKVANRPGGYTRIIRTGNRLGDNAEMCLIELVDYNELYTNGKETKKKRSRRGGSKKSSSENQATAPEAKVEAPEVVEAAEEVTPEVEEVAEADAETETKAEESVEENEKKEDKAGE